MGKRKIGLCKLCLKQAELCNSHIIPKFIWRDSGVIGKERKFSVRCISEPTLSEYNKQDGFKEHLLCNDCEARFQKFEIYMKPRLKVIIAKENKRPSGHIVLQGWDYKQTKLFQMSLLWRMGVSNQAFYSHVCLGVHQERIRKMLLINNPGKPWQYGCISVLLTHNGNPIPGIFSQPEKNKRGINCYRVLIAGMLWIYPVRSHQRGGIMEMGYLKENGDWVMLQGEIKDFKSLSERIKLL